MFALALGDRRGALQFPSTPRSCGGVLLVLWCAVPLPSGAGRDPTLKNLPEKVADFVFNSPWKRDCKTPACPLGLESKAASWRPGRGRGCVRQWGRGPARGQTGTEMWKNRRVPQRVVSAFPWGRGPPLSLNCQ